MSIDDFKINIQFYGGPCDGAFLTNVPLLKIPPVIRKDGWEYKYEEEPILPPDEPVDDYKLHVADQLVAEKVYYLGDYRPWYSVVGPVK